MDWDTDSDQGEHDFSDEEAEDYPPIEVESGGFTFDLRSGLRYKHIAPEPVADLRLLFRKNAAKSRVRAANKPWVSAQLRLYDIPFKASGKADELKSTLEAAVKAGKCNKLPVTTVAKEKALREKLKGQLKQYERKRQQQHDETFARLSSPSGQAEFDFDKFLLKYFLDDQGKPAPHKQPDALILQMFPYDGNSPAAVKVRSISGLQFHGSEQPDLAVIGWQGLSFEKGVDEAFATMSEPDFRLHTATCEAIFDTNRFMAKYFLSGLKGRPEKQKTPKPVELYHFLTPAAEAAVRDAARSIPGLHVSQTLYHNHSVFVGWGSDKVTAFVQQIEKEASRREEQERLQEEAQEKAEYEQEVKRKLQRHREYVKKHRPHIGPLKLEHIVGSYSVECAELDGELTLDIHSQKSTFGTTAAFNFGIVEGTMMMALSEDALEQLWEEIEQDEKDSEYGSQDGEEDEDECADRGLYGSSIPTKRKAKGQLETSRPVVKRRLGETQRPNRVYLRWRGRETGEGEIERGQEEQHVGHLDFRDNGLTAQGVFVHPNFFGDKKLEIKIYKIDDNPQREVEAWSAFSEEQRTYMSTARWH